MIIQAFLTSLFAVLMVSGLLFARSYPLVGFSLAIASAAAVLPVWRPEWATVAANAMGVGRGADLLLYVWFSISTLLFLVQHLRMMRLEDRLADLVRELAVRQFAANMAGTPEPNGEDRH